jgi:hypothetical protein
MIVEKLQGRSKRGRFVKAPEVPFCRIKLKIPKLHVSENGRDSHLL